MAWRWYRVWVAARVWLFPGSATGFPTVGRPVMSASAQGRSSLWVTPQVRLYRDLNGDGLGDLGVMRASGALEVFAGTGDASGFPSTPIRPRPMPS